MANENRRFTLRAAMQDEISPALNRLRSNLRSVTQPLRQLVTGMRDNDRELTRAARNFRRLQAAGAIAAAAIRQVERAARTLGGPLRLAGRLVGSVLRRAFTTLTSPIRGVIRLFTSFGAQLAALAGVAGIALTVRALLNLNSALDELAKRGRRLGIAPEEFERLRLAAGFSGVEFTDLANAIERAQRNLSEFARTGKGTAALVLRELNLELFDAQGELRDVTDLLPEIADKLKDVENQSDRVRIAYALFGRSGTALLQVLQAGSGPLQDLTRDFERLAPALASGQVFQIAEDYEDAFLRVRTAVHGLGASLIEVLGPGLTRLLNGLAPRLADFGQQFVNVVAGLREAFSNDEAGRTVSAALKEIGVTLVATAFEVGIDIGGAVFRGVAEAVRVASPLLGDALSSSLGNALVQASSGALSLFYDNLIRLIDAVESVFGEMGVTAQLRELADLTDEGAEGASEFASQFGDRLRDELNGARFGGGLIDGAGELRAELQDRLGASLDIVGLKLGEIGEIGAEAIAKTREAAKEAADGAGEAADETEEAGKRASDNLDTWRDGLQGITDGFERTIQSGNSFAQLGETIGAGVAQGLGGISNVLRDVIAGTKSASDAFRSFFATLLGNLAQAIIQFAIFRAISGLAGIGPAAGVGAAAAVVPANKGGLIDASRLQMLRLNAGGRVSKFKGMVGQAIGPDRDSLLAYLTPGEFVFSRSAVRAAGGPAAMARLQAKLLGQLPAYNFGGPVGLNVAGGSTPAGGGAPSAASLDLNDGRLMERLGRRVIPVVLAELRDDPQANQRFRALVGG